MYLTDWAIVWGLILFLIIMAWWTKRYTRSVADFLAANRCGGRYLLGVAEGVATLGAISIIAEFEVFYQAGFSASWWKTMTEPIFLIVALSGWIYYRFRQTRCFTVAQFFEVRYSKSFRIFCGVLAFTAGIINFGIFPAAGARFFIHFCGLPQTVPIGGVGVSTFALVMIFLLGIALFFTFAGGQIAVMVTDFFQGIFCYIAFAVLLCYFLITIDWSTIMEGLSHAGEGKSMINPLRSGGEKEFNMWFYVISVVTMIYTPLAWQGRGAYNCSARSPHEAKMGKVIGGWRTIILGMVLVFLPVCAYAVMHHPNFAVQAGEVTAALDAIENPYIQEQMTTSVTMAKVLPTGLLGIFCAMMAAAFISTHDTYLHSWGSIFVQDVILPFRKKPFTPKQHMRLLKWSIFGVAVFIFLFSFFFVQRINIHFFFAITGGIFFGGVGSAVIGGLYWKRGSTAAAWSATIVGAVLCISSTVVHHLWPIIYGEGAVFPINGQYLVMIAMGAAVLVYILVSVLGKKTEFNMNRLLHRGEYAIEEESTGDKPPMEQNKSFWATWGGLITKEFTRGDKFIYGAMLVWILAWTAIFVVGTIYGTCIGEISDGFWSKFWHFKVWLSAIVTAITAVWFFIGGMFDVRKMFKALSAAKRNYLDDGRVVDHRNVGELEEERDTATTET